MKSVLEVTGLRVERGATTILHGVAWRVARGEHWVILGANGSASCPSRGDVEPKAARGPPEPASDRGRRGCFVLNLR